jgi:hypothetical protein
LNAAGVRKVPADAPREFIPAKWESYVMAEQDQLSRRYYELCLLWEVRTALRNGNLWIEGSRRYTNPESYLIPPERWVTLRTEACSQMKVPEDGRVRFQQRVDEYLHVAALLAQQLSGHSQVRVEDGELIVSPLTVEERPAGCVVLEEKIVERLPHIDLPALLIEVDGWVNFTTAFTHAGGSEPRKADLLPTLYASLLAQSGNFGLTQMGADVGLQLSTIAMDDALVSAGGNAAGTHRGVSQLPSSAAPEPLARRRDFVLIRWTTLSCRGKNRERHTAAEVFRLRARSDFLHVDLRSIFAVRDQGHSSDNARRNGRAG